MPHHTTYITSCELLPFAVKTLENPVSSRAKYLLHVFFADEQTKLAVAFVGVLIHSLPLGQINKSLSCLQPVNSKSLVEN